jgi:beta-glucan synthesis-associated protein KRE6
MWGTDLYHSEADDHMHNPDPKRDKTNDMSSNICTSRGLGNLGCLAILGIAMVGLLYVFPLLTSRFMGLKLRI